MINTKFTGNKKIDVSAGGFTVKVDLTKADGGDETAPNPFMLMLASFAACSAYHVLLLAEKLKMNREDFHLELTPILDKNGDMEKAQIKIFVPADFPKEREAMLLKAVQGCKVGRHLKAERSLEIVRA